MELEKIKSRLEARNQQRQNALENQRTGFLLKIKARVPDFLDEFPEVSKIVVFGSLIRPDYFTGLSDLDIAVKGLPNSEYWPAFGWLEKTLESENIDLVRMEDAKPGILESIDKGQVIYAKKSREPKSSKI